MRRRRFTRAAMAVAQTNNCNCARCTRHTCSKPDNQNQESDASKRYRPASSQRYFRYSDCPSERTPTTLRSSHPTALPDWQWASESIAASSRDRTNEKCRSSTRSAEEWKSGHPRCTAPDRKSGTCTPLANTSPDCRHPEGPHKRTGNRPVPLPAPGNAFLWILFHRCLLIFDSKRMRPDSFLPRRLMALVFLGKATPRPSIRGLLTEGH